MKLVFRYSLQCYKDVLLDRVFFLNRCISVEIRTKDHTTGAQEAVTERLVADQSHVFIMICLLIKIPTGDGVDYTYKSADLPLHVEGSMGRGEEWILVYNKFNW